MIYDPVIDNRFLIEGQKERIAEEVIKIFSEVFPHLKEVIVSYNQRNLTDILNKIQTIINENFQSLDEYVQEQLSELGFLEAKFEDRYYQEIVQEQTGVNAIPYAISLAIIAASIPKIDVQGNSYTSEINLIKYRLIQDIKKKVRFGLLSGQEYTDIFNNVSKSINKTGNGLNNLVATTTQAVISDIAEEYANKNKAQSDLEMYIAVMDSKTTRICRRNNGKIFKEGEGQRVPAHYNCRSIRVKYYKNIKDGAYKTFIDAIKNDEIDKVYKKGDSKKYSFETFEKKQNALIEKEKATK